MRNAGGYHIITDPDARGPEECDTFTCAHCNRVVFVKPKQSPTDIGGLCYICTALVCPECVAKGICDPLEDQLKREEARYDTLRSYGMV